MKKLSLAILGLLVLLIPLLALGCETGTPTQTASLFVTAETYNAGINAMQGQLNGKANQTDLNTMATDVATLKGQGAGNTYTKGELYTRAEVDAAIAAAVAALKANQTWITGTTHTTPAGTTAGEYGELIDTDGDLELWLDRVSGEVEDVFFSRNGQSAEGRFDLIVVNKDTGSSHDFTISLNLSPDADVELDMAVTATKVEASSGYTFSLTRTNTARNPLMVFQSNTGRVTKGDIEDFTIWLTLKQTSATTSPVEWDYDFSIKDKD